MVRLTRREGASVRRCPARMLKAQLDALPQPGSGAPLLALKGGLSWRNFQVEPCPPPRMRVKAEFWTPADAVGLRTAQMCAHTSHACLGVHLRQPQCRPLRWATYRGQTPRVRKSLSP